MCIIHEKFRLLCQSKAWEGNSSLIATFTCDKYHNWERLLGTQLPIKLLEDFHKFVSIACYYNNNIQHNNNHRNDN